MFRNYFKTTLSNLLRDKLFSLINIAGLSIGLTACIFIALYVLDETSYDKHWSNAERIYRVNATVDFTGASPRKFSQNYFPTLPALQNTFGDAIELGARAHQFGVEIRLEDQSFQVSPLFVDPDFATLFPFETLAGNLDQALADPSRIALSEDVAQRIFGNRDAIGEVVTINVGIFREVRDFEVAAVYRLPDENSILAPETLMRIDPVDIANIGFDSWVTMGSATYIQLAEFADIAAISAALPEFTDRNVDISGLQAGPGVAPRDRVSFELQNIRDIYLNSPFDPLMAGGNSTAVQAFSAIAVLVLLIGCINFTILSTARATRRAKEVGMRKAVGAVRSQLLFQFIGESLLIVFPAIMVSLALVELGMPVFETLVGKEVAIAWLDPTTILALVALILIVGLVGGSYPAFVLSGFRPADTLMSNRSSETGHTSRLRNLLVIFQFGVSIALIIATVVIYAQVNYVSTRDPGFNKENVLTVDGLGGEVTYPLKDSFKARVETLPDVMSAGFSVHQPTQQFGMATNAASFRVNGEAGDGQLIARLGVDEDFLPTYEILLLAGRNFDALRDQLIDVFLANSNPDVLHSAILNESAVRQLGFAGAADAIGRQLEVNGNERVLRFAIIGVVSDTQFFTLRAAPRAEVYLHSPYTPVLSIRYRGEADGLLARIQSIWQEMFGDVVMTTGFVETNMAEEFAREETEAGILVSFSVLAVLIACLGLYGSAAFTVDRRTKEIGVRKVMGAEVRQIVTLLLWDFSRPVLIANVFAWPAAVWAMLRWLQQFPYQIDTQLLIPFCVFAGAVALLIAWLTVAGNTVKVATTNPVYALRYE
jgi:putative ABC transport system permease protein